MSDQKQLDRIEEKPNQILRTPRRPSPPDEKVKVYRIFDGEYEYFDVTLFRGEALEVRKVQTLWTKHSPGPSQMSERVFQVIQEAKHRERDKEDG